MTESATPPNADKPSEKRFLRALRREVVDRPPFWFMRQAGRYLPEYQEMRGRAADFLKFCYDPAMATEVTLQPIRRFGMDAAIIFSDILVIPDALGQKVAFEKGRGPVLEPIEDPKALPTFDADKLTSYLEPVYEALRQTKAALPQDVALIGFAGAPWTIAAYMVEGGSSRDFEKLKGFAYGRPAAFSAVIDLLVESISAHLIAQVEAGAEALQLFDSWAGVLPEPQFQRWCVEPAMRIVRKVKAAHPNVPIIGFPNRAGALYGLYATESGVDAMSIDATVPLDWAASSLQSRVVLQGNLDPMMLVTGGEAMKTEARRILGALGKGPFIFNLGHGVPQITPPAHVAELSALLQNWQPS
ncbi:MAG TPA: uroporphyrinogen decarboxylase [Alphaproteobacteria bacterium]|nr:uroporphyrinogen decarboxylase [Alphaproteobacteria bacterium]